MRASTRASIVFATLAILGLAVSTGHAQPVTGTTYLSNIDPNAPQYFGNWDTANANEVSTPTGLEFQVNNGMAGGGGENPNPFTSMYYALPVNQVTPMDSADTQVTFDYLWNSGNAVAGVNVLFSLDDSLGNADYYGTGYVIPAPGLNSFTFALQAGNQAAISGGGVVNGLNFQIDPANVYGPYDITYSSITLSQVPEPASIAVMGVATCLLAARRRHRTA
jgi:hypothetical protein